MLTQAAQWMISLALVGTVWLTVPHGVMQLVAIGVGISLSAILSYRYLANQFRLPLLLEDRIAQFSSDSLFQLTPISLGSPLAVRWNSLVDQAHKWQSAQALMQQIETRFAQSSSQHNDAILDALAEGILLTNQAGSIRYANHGCETLFPEQVTQFKSMTWQQLFCTHEQPSKEALQEMKSRSTFDITRRNAGGESRIIRCHRRPFTNDSGEQQGHIWILRDITQQRLAEEMREKFLASATHELRTPLANIHAYAESLTVADDIDPESQKRFYNIIQTEAARLTKLINDLLDVNRMQAGSFSLDLHETDLSRLVEEAAKKVQAQSQEKQLDFRVDISPKLPKVMVDKPKLVAALVNLLGNAMKYTPEHGRVSFAVDANAQQLEFVVTDTGIGIAPEELPHVFDKFFRSDDERVRDIPGSGLGLAFTQEVARLHGGDIEVASTLNQGSSFRLTLPLELQA
jgi:PAS domain S-box-containing protein